MQFCYQDPKPIVKRPRTTSPDFVKPHGKTKRVAFSMGETQEAGKEDGQEARLLAPDTCDTSLEEREIRRRPSLLVPETWAEHVDDDFKDMSHAQDHDTSEVLCPTTEPYSMPPPPDTDSMAHVELSPPVYASTPATALRNHRPLPAKPVNPIFTDMTETDDADEGSQAGITDEHLGVAGKDLTRHDPTQTSPVKRIRQPPIPTPESPSPLSSPLKRFTISRPDPDLYQDEELEEDPKGGDRKPQPLDLTNSKANLSTVSNTSPSVISGKILSLTASQDSSTSSNTAAKAARTTRHKAKASPLLGRRSGLKGQGSALKGQRLRGSQDDPAGDGWLSSLTLSTGDSCPTSRSGRYCTHIVCILDIHVHQLFAQLTDFSVVKMPCHL